VARNVRADKSELQANHLHQMQDIGSQLQVGLALCMDLARSRHLRPITGSPGGVAVMPESSVRLGACLLDLIRRAHGKG
jgi:hypothetical protein